MSRRQRFSEFYKHPHNMRIVKNDAGDSFHLVEKSAASADKYSFRGDKEVHAVVVRCDLNGFTKWSNEHSLDARKELLGEFFSHIMSKLEPSGGIYFRDEGDCLIALFSAYFNPINYQTIESFCQSVVGREYGKDKLSAKACVACGEIAIYQKPHEAGSDDWSADGPAFVNAVRLEQAVDSKPQVNFFADEYEEHFESGTSYAKPGQTYYWIASNESKQVAGLGFEGGWVELRCLTHIPKGKISEAPRYSQSSVFANLGFR